MRMFTLLQSGFGIIMIGFAVAVKRDADNMQRQKEKLFLVSPNLWAFATLLGGVMVAVAYWAIHYSTLAPKREEEMGKVSE